MVDWRDLKKAAAYLPVKEMIDFFKKSETALDLASKSLSEEDIAEALVDRVYETREAYVAAINMWEPETLVEISERLGLWVLQNYPDKKMEPRNEWDRLVLQAYFQLTGFIGVEPVREE